MYTKYSKWFINLSLIGVLTGALSSAASLPSNEHQAKMDHLLKFSQSLIWPDSAFETPNAPFCICILGQERFQNFNILYQKANGRTIHLLTLDNFRQANACHTLFISESEQDRLTTILAYTQTYPILTVSDIEDFVLQGGMIQFYKWTNRIRFMFDPQTIDEIGIIMQID